MMVVAVTLMLRVSADLKGSSLMMLVHSTATTTPTAGKR